MGAFEHEIYDKGLRMPSGFDLRQLRLESIF